VTAPEVGRVYARRRSGKAEVVRVTAAAGEWAEFRYLHGPDRAMRVGTGRCKVKNFPAAGWEATEERADYSDLDGADRYDTVLVLDTAGEPILRCSRKRAAFYTRKGLAAEAGPGTLRFTDPRTERRLRTLYRGGFSAFFLAVKNDRCVCCGATADLTRHHVVPRRHKRNVPRPWRSCLSNVLFVCSACHRRYEEAREPEPGVTGGDWRGYVRAWRDHFVRVLGPRFLPDGWDIISVTDLSAVEYGPDGPR
jgi:hypothetical protein